MRTETFLLICTGFTFTAILTINRVLGAMGLAVPFSLDLVTSPLVSAGLGFVIGLALTPINKRIRQWRKTRGRDIDEEERYESDHGMISLTPKDKNGLER